MQSSLQAFDVELDHLTLGYVVHDDGEDDAVEHTPTHQLERQEDPIPGYAEIVGIRNWSIL